MFIAFIYEKHKAVNAAIGSWQTRKQKDDWKQADQAVGDEYIEMRYKLVVNSHDNLLQVEVWGGGEVK